MRPSDIVEWRVSDVGCLLLHLHSWNFTKLKNSVNLGNISYTGFLLTVEKDVKQCLPTDMTDHSQILANYVQTEQGSPVRSMLFAECLGFGATGSVRLWSSRVKSNMIASVSSSNSTLSTSKVIEDFSLDKHMKEKNKTMIKYVVIIVVGWFNIGDRTYINICICTYKKT